MMPRPEKMRRAPTSSGTRRVRAPIQHDPWGWARNGDLWSGVAGAALLLTIAFLGLLKAVG